MTAHRPSGGPLRVVHLTTVSDSLNLLLACELETVRAAGAEVIGISGPGSPGQAPADVTLQSLTRRMDVRSDLQVVRDLYETLRRLQPDVIHTHTPKAGVLGRLVGRMARVPVVVNTCHGLIVPPTGAAWKRFLLGAVEGTAALFSDAELYQSAADRDRLRRFVSGRKARVVGNGTDLDRFRFERSTRELARAALNIGPETLVVLGVGRQVRDKGIVEYWATAAELRRPGVEFMWAGGPEPDKADGVEMSGTVVRMLGHVHDMPALYMAADIFVLPSYREGFPRSAMEAAATGLPLVLSDIPGCRQLGEDVALFVRPADGAALIAALERALEDGALRTQLSRAAQRRAGAAFDQRRVAERSLDTYRDAASRKRTIDMQRIPALTVTPFEPSIMRFPQD